ncbi:ATP-binding protein [Streptomyces sp. HNM0663]|uniref:ATP-binding protein n=1 Tax=Streptomyces chengmaiensis TaxID=3040919 RepID=A0ABT6HTP0_9ACTN|nr:ATP-binding protein [Streptomyces chengmaiensis]MDH2392096.1 ATP-binding protein [Streptomyces chengmaiensis]
MPYSYTLFCPPLPTSPRIARDFVASVLRAQELDDFVDRATLCTSELVTNAYRHTMGIGSLLWLAVRDKGVRVTVYDGERRRPVMLHGYDGASGRGMWLVDAVTEGRWGTETGAPLGFGAQGGKGVWFELVRTC